jgi:signal transduction histidine kinase
MGYDSLLFRLVFNLAENAIKYTPSGRRIDVTLEQQDHQAILRVTDNGAGFPAHALEHIFDRFLPSRFGARRQRHRLGLALVRSIVQLHSGQIMRPAMSAREAAFA